MIRVIFDKIKPSVLFQTIGQLLFFLVLSLLGAQLVRVDDLVVVAAGIIVERQRLQAQLQPQATCRTQKKMNTADLSLKQPLLGFLDGQ